MQKNLEPQAARPSELVKERANAELAGLPTGIRGVSVVKEPVLTGIMSEDIMKQLVHVARRSALMNHHLANCSIYHHQGPENTGSGGGGSHHPMDNRSPEDVNAA